MSSQPHPIDALFSEPQGGGALNAYDDDLASYDVQNMLQNHGSFVLMPNYPVDSQLASAASAMLQQQGLRSPNSTQPVPAATAGPLAISSPSLDHSNTAAAGASVGDEGGMGDKTISASLAAERVHELIHQGTLMQMHRKRVLATVGGASAAGAATGSSLPPALTGDDEIALLQTINTAASTQTEQQQQVRPLGRQLSSHTPTRGDSLIATDGGEVPPQGTLGGRSVTSDGSETVGPFCTFEIQHARPPRGSEISDLLRYNRAWAAESVRVNPTYFADLAKLQRPQYFWIGCSDSRVPANQIVGLAPGEVFVHRNVANCVPRSDLCSLSTIQYAVEVCQVEHIIVCGHYGCGGVTAAMRNISVGLADNWINNVVDVRKKFSAVLSRIPDDKQVPALCELNVITQLTHVAESHAIQRAWKEHRAALAAVSNASLTASTPPATTAAAASHGTLESIPKPHDVIMKAPADIEYDNPGRDVVSLHGWIYGLDNGQVHPLVTITFECDVEAVVRAAVEGVEGRYSTNPPPVLTNRSFSSRNATPAHVVVAR